MANVIATLKDQVILTGKAAAKLSHEVRAKLVSTGMDPNGTLPVVQQGMNGQWLAHRFMGQPFNEAMLAGEACELTPQDDGSVTATIKLWDTEAGFAAGQRMKQPTGWMCLISAKNTGGEIMLEVDVFNREEIDSAD